MPRIPEAAAPRPIAVPESRIGGMLQRTFTEMGEQLQSIMKERNENSQRNELVKLSGEMDAELLKLQLEIERDPNMNDATAATAAYAERSQEIIKGTLGRAKWESVGMALQARGMESATHGGLTVNRRAYKREVDAAVADLAANEDTDVASYTMEEGPLGRANIRKTREVDLGLGVASGHISETDAQRLLKNFDTRANTNLVLRLVNEGRFDEARAIVTDPEQVPGMDETDRYSIGRTIAAAEARAESDAKRQQADFEEGIAKSAFLAIQRSREGVGPAYGLEEFERDLPNLSFSDAKSIRTAMSKQDAAEVDDPDELIHLHRMIDAGDTGAREQINNSYAAGLIRQPTYESLLDEDRAVNEDRIFSQPYVEARHLITDSLGPLPAETRAGARSAAALRTRSALEELQRFRESNPGAPRAQISEEASRIVGSYAVIDFADTALTLATPYGSPDKQAAQKDLAELDRAAARVLEDLESGVIDKRRATDEENTIQKWRELLERRARLEAVRSSAQ